LFNDFFCGLPKNHHPFMRHTRSRALTANNAKQYYRTSLTFASDSVSAIWIFSFFLMFYRGIDIVTTISAKEQSESNLNICMCIFRKSILN